MCGLSLESVLVGARHGAAHAAIFHMAEDLNCFRFLKKEVVDAHKHGISVVWIKSVAEVFDHRVDRRRQTRRSLLRPFLMPFRHLHVARLARSVGFALTRHLLHALFQLAQTALPRLGFYRSRRQHNACRHGRYNHFVVFHFQLIFYGTNTARTGI